MGAARRAGAVRRRRAARRLDRDGRAQGEGGRVVGRDDVQPAVAAEHAFKTLNIKSVYILHDKTAYGQGVVTDAAHGREVQIVEIRDHAGGALAPRRGGAGHERDRVARVDEVEAVIAARQQHAYAPITGPEEPTSYRNRVRGHSGPR